MSDLESVMRKAVEAMAASGMELTLPPPVFAYMGGEMVKYAEGKSLLCVFPTLEQFANPTGFYQGGMIASAFDNAYGALSFLTAGRPCVTVTLDTAFIRPMRVGPGQFQVDARVRAASKSLLFLEAKALNMEGKLVAVSSTTMALMQLKEDQTA